MRHAENGGQLNDGHPTVDQVLAETGQALGGSQDG